MLWRGAKACCACLCANPLYARKLVTNTTPYLRGGGGGPYVWRTHAGKKCREMAKMGQKMARIIQGKSIRLMCGAFELEIGAPYYNVSAYIYL